MKLNLRLLAFPGGRWLGWGAALAVILPLLWQNYQSRLPFNGFNLDNTAVSRADIFSGGPGKDGIPALTDPAVVMAKAAKSLNDDDRVIGLVVNDVAHAYPLRILTWHEVINDRLDGEPVVVTFCPLCGTGIAYRGSIDGQRLDFGVSGLLYRDNLLMYDRGTRSLWSQIEGRAISGPRKGERLEPLPIEHATWSEWRRRYPQTGVLSFRTGYSRDYSRDPYRDYATSPWSPGFDTEDRLPPKARVIGVRLGGETRAYPFPTLALIAPEDSLRDRLGGQSITIAYSAIDYSARVEDADGNVLPMTLAYWFAWRDRYPKTDIYEAANGPASHHIPEH